jgi:oligoribonuclease (3'-5' exoribonuclease)
MTDKFKDKYVAIDTETTGLDPKSSLILEIAAVVDSIHEPLENAVKFHCIIAMEHIYGGPFALGMNHEILDIMARKKDHPDILFLNYDEAAAALCKFLKENFEDTPTPAGKNFAGFDRAFLRELPGGDKIKLRHRAIDVGELWWEPTTDGFDIPDSQECLRRAGIDRPVTHRAMPDAIDTCELIRRHPKTRNLFAFPSLTNA